MILVQRVPVFAFMASSGLGGWGAFSVGKPKPPSPWPLPPASLRGCRGVPMSDEKSNLSSKFLVCLGISSWLDMSKTPTQEDVQEGSWPDAPTTNWFLSMWRSSGLTLSPSWIYEVLTLSLMLSPATLWKKLFSSACVHNFILLVLTAYDHKWGLECGLIGRLRALSSSSALYLPKRQI